MRWLPIRTFLAVALVAVGLVSARGAYAQRTEENVTTGSEDAFGRSIGNESIGIYNEGDVRGFSPIEAGNVRIEGLYFDRLGSLTSRLIEGSTIRVGIASQSYPFPSPTGIVDYDLRRVGEKPVISTLLSYGPYGGLGAEIDAQLPLTRELGTTVGLGLYRDAFPWGGDNESYSFAIAPQWRPTENLELRPFFSVISFKDEEAEPLMLTTGEVLPPQVRREHYYGQDWATNEGKGLTYGVLGAARFDAWTTRLGVFESVYEPDASFAELFTDIDPSGNSNELVVAFPHSRFSSTSGELRVARAFEGGERRHLLQFAARARLQKRRYGGEDVIDVGPVQVGVGREVPEPVFVFGEQSHDEVKQETLGALYELQWAKLGEMSVGVQKTSYSKTVDTPGGSLPESRAKPWLKYATATLNANEQLAFYASYTEGLEESPVAPNNAVNRNVAAPALETQQYDAGLRWAAFAKMKLIAGIFNVEKPYFDLDATGVFRELGTVEHRGVEVSLAGDPLEDLTVILGTRWLDATVTGPTVDAGLIGEKPVGSTREYSFASADYRLPGIRASIDATVEHISSQVANSANTIEVPSRAVLHVGGRYRFEMFGKPATLRLLVQNITDKYGWIAQSSGAYIYNSPRRFTVYVAADF